MKVLFCLPFAFAGICNLASTLTVPGGSAVFIPDDNKAAGSDTRTADVEDKAQIAKWSCKLPSSLDHGSGGLESINEGIKYISGKGDAGKVSIYCGKQTTRESCSWDSAIWVSNDRDETRTINYHAIADHAKYIRRHCATAGLTTTMGYIVKGISHDKRGFRVWIGKVNKADGEHC